MNAFLLLVLVLVLLLFGVCWRNGIFLAPQGSEGGRGGHNEADCTKQHRSQKVEHADCMRHARTCECLYFETLGDPLALLVLQLYMFV